MSKLFSILTASLLLVQSLNISIADFKQFNELLEHASYHNETYGDNFFVFISEHYGALKAEHSKKHLEEHSDHEEPPFNHGSCFHGTTSIFVLFQTKLPVLKTITENTKTENFYYYLSKSLLFAPGIFQPPRQA